MVAGWPMICIRNILLPVYLVLTPTRYRDRLQRAEERVGDWVSFFQELFSALFTSSSKLSYANWMTPWQSVCPMDKDTTQLWNHRQIMRASFGSSWDLIIYLNTALLVTRNYLMSSLEAIKPLANHRERTSNALLFRPDEVEPRKTLACSRANKI